MSCTDQFESDQTTTATTKMNPSRLSGLVLLLLLLLFNCIIGLMATAASITSVQNQQDLIDYEQQQQQARNNQLLVQASQPIEISSNDSTNSSATAAASPLSNYQLVSQNSRFKVNVSNVCEKNHMKVTIRLNRPFYGLIHAKDKRKKVLCFVEGTGDQLYTFDVSFTLLPADPAYCGMVVHNHQLAAASWTRQQQQQTSNQSMLHGSHQQQQQQQQETLSLALVVRLHKTIEFSDDRYFLLSCPNRCSRSDCSTSFSQSEMQPQERRGFVASDSILAPVFRSNSANQDKQLLLRQSATGAETSTSCDMMIDLKFQWLVKLCWILIGLIALMFCIIFYLCVSPSSTDKSSSSSSRGRKRKSSASLSSRSHHHHREKHQATTSRKSNTSQSSDQSSTSYMAKSSAVSADSPESFATTRELQASSWTTNDQQQQQQQMDKLRENNHYLANKQHLLLTDFLAAKSAMEEYDHQQQQHQHQSTRQQQQQQQQQIMGRADDTTFGNSRQFFNPLPRRRSIGGSAAMLNCLQGTETLPTVHHQQRSDQLGARLDPKHKLKSKSQTTIYYEQGQDPFKAIPFDIGPYVGNGYPQPELVHRAQLRPYSFVDQVQHSDTNGNFVHDTSAHWPVTYEPQSMPMMTDVDHKAADLFAPDFKANQSWQITQTSPVQAPEPPVRGQQLPPDHSLSNSQFDPQNNSLQLIELIQSKHREQMAQANRTAASIRTNNATSTNNQPKKPMPKPILTSSQRQTSLVNNRSDQQWR